MKENRKYTVQIVFILVGIVYLAKLFAIQITDDSYKLAAEDNVMRAVTEYAYRGLISDRTGKELLVFNRPVFDIMVVPREAEIQDTALFCELIGISREEFDKEVIRMQKDRGYKSHLPQVLIKMVSQEQFAQFQDRLIDFPGFFAQPRMIRGYGHQSLANALGYIGEVSQQDLNRDTTNYYKSGDYIGISGLERSYEKILRGKQGVQFKMFNAIGVVKGPYKNGKLDTASVPGKNLISTIDMDLQRYGEMLLKGKAGAAVAIEPATGEILSIISSPSYDPAALSGRSFGKKFLELTQDSLTPLFNRSVSSVYPPGSTFKPLQALIALQEGVITPNEQIYCSGALVGDHAPPGYYDVFKGIQKSSNNYFYIVFRRIINRNLSENTFIDSRIGLEKWNGYLRRFGLGDTLGIDIPNEKGGTIPTPELYNRIYGENRWKWSTINSISIGQGELLISPLQMANMAAAIANRGYYYAPHIIKEIDSLGRPLPKYQVKHETGVDSTHFKTVIDAMESVVNQGTGIRARIDGIPVCGKTGTSQNPHGEDHSVFIAFAPKENPKIAIFVYVQNAGQGARAAASVAGLMIEKYLTGEIKRHWIEDYALKGDFIY